MGKHLSTFHLRILLKTTKKWNDEVLGRYTQLAKILIMAPITRKLVITTTTVGNLENEIHDESLECRSFVPHPISTIVYQFS